MFKKILVGALAIIMIVAIGTSAYNTLAGNSAQIEAQTEPVEVQVTQAALVAELPENIPSASSTAEAEVEPVPATPALPETQSRQGANAFEEQGRGARRRGADNGNGNGNRWQGSQGSGAAGANATTYDLP